MSNADRKINYARTLLQHITSNIVPKRQREHVWKLVGLWDRNEGQLKLNIHVLCAK
jgi:hypothetical protein